MSGWLEFTQRDGRIPEWPYPVRYEVENEVSADVLVLGGGIAGSHAAINAARKGAKVVVVEKGDVSKSGQGGPGVDHWQGVCTAPFSKVTPSEMTEAVVKNQGGYDCGIVRYIQCKESYDTLLDVEKMGVQVRDVGDEFKGAEFRDAETKIMFAYDYENKHTIRVMGHNMKPSLAKEMERLGVKIYNRVMATSLLTEGGKQGGRVVGATGVDVRTGEFYIFKAKATILCIPGATRLWIFSTELMGAASIFNFPLNTGEGLSTAWKAGAELAMCTRTLTDSGGFKFLDYGMGNVDHTWHACTIVDANGKEVPWVDRDGNEIKTVSARYYPAPGQKVIISCGQIGAAMRYSQEGDFPVFYENRWPTLIPDLAERIKKGEFVLPLYADLTAMPPLERRALFGLMVGNESKSRYPVYYTLTKAGFDPDKDLLQAPLFEPDRYPLQMWNVGVHVPQWRGISGPGIMVDWDLRTNLKGLYAAGAQIFGGTEHAGSATAGKYAARQAVAYAQTSPEPVIDRKQLDTEKTRVYAPTKRKSGVIGWKELNAAICRIMQDYCAELRQEKTLKMGIDLLQDLRETEYQTLSAANPHDLAHILECDTFITVGQIVMNASLIRKASSLFLHFKRLEYPEMDPLEWNKFLPMRLEGREIKYRELPLDYHLQPPYAPTYEENYKQHCTL